MKPYLLALDLGTSSIGHTVFELDANDEPINILDIGVRIFPDGREPKSKEPLAVQRRIARGIRRTRDRGQNRVRRLVTELIDTGLLPSDEAERKKVFDKICPYEARSAATNTVVNANTLGRALFHLGRRRGFKSNRLSDSAEESDYKAKISSLREELGQKTLGEYLYAKQLANKKLAAEGRPIEQKAIRFRAGETEHYADRAMYKEEFDRIKARQCSNLLSDEQWNMLEETIFWQYPLRPAPKGKCRFYPEETRAHIDLPISHQYRIYQEVNSLRYISEGVEHELDKRQREALYQLLHSTLNLTFKGLPKKKDASKAPYFPSDAIFNLDVEGRSGKLQGNRVMIDLAKPEYLGDLIHQIDFSKLNDICHHLIEPVTEVNGRKVVLEKPAIIAWLKAELPELSDEQRENLYQYRFKRDTASVSRKFMEQINPILYEQGCIYSDAVKHVTNEYGIAFHHSDFETGEVLTRLPYYGEIMPESVWGAQPEADKDKAPNERDEDAYNFGKIANPTVHLALNQLRFTVNSVIDKLGDPPAKIHVELTRDLKNSKEARDRMARDNAKNKKENDRIRTFLKEEFDEHNPSRDDIQKVKLWEELGAQGFRRCVFSGRAIPASKLFNGEVEVEHIIPFSRCYDDGVQNKTLAYKDSNNIKGNKTPHEAFGDDPDNYRSILDRALQAFGSGRKFDRFKEDAYERFYGEDAGGDMIARQLNDTRYISRKAAQYLSCLVTRPNVVSVNGAMTALLRDVWQLNRFKNRAEGHYRDDHRHHIVDAFVVGLTSRSLIQKLSSFSSKTGYTKDRLYDFLKARAPAIDELKRQLNDRLEGVVASYKPDHTDKGSLFNDTAYGLVDEAGASVGVTKKAPASLSFDEVFKIRDTHLREQYLKHLTGQTGVLDKKHLKELVGSDKQLSKLGELFTANTGIKKLRIIVLNDSIQPIKSAPYKGYAKNSYAYCDVWRVPTKNDTKTGKMKYKYEGDFAAYSELGERKSNPEFGRPHPAAKKLVRLYKHDSIKLTDKETGEASFWRIAGYSAGQNKLDIQRNLNAKPEKQNFKSVNQIFSDNLVNKLRN